MSDCFSVGGEFEFTESVCPRGCQLYGGLRSRVPWSSTTMDLFSEDLFNVFEATEKPTPGKSKKRKREAQETSDDGAKPTDEDSKKKVKVDSAGEGSSAAISSASEVAAGSSREVRNESKDAESSQDQNSEV